MPEQNRYGLDQLDFFLAHTRDWKADIAEFAATIAEAKDRPELLRDADIERIRRNFTNAQGDVVLFENQARWWADEAQTDAHRRGLETLNADLDAVRSGIAGILADVDQIAERTIDAVMAKSDLQVGLESLTGMAWPRGSF